MFLTNHIELSGGGEGLPEDTLNIETVPLQWMEHEALMAGVLFHPHKIMWSVDGLLKAAPHKSLHGAWRLLEVIPVRRQTQTNPKEASRTLHNGRGRAIYPGQKIHASVAFMDQHYKPKATFKHAPTLDWTYVVGHGPSGHFLRYPEWNERLDLDLFDVNAGQEWMSILRRNEVCAGGALRLLTRLDFISSLRDGDKAFSGIEDAVPVLQQHLSCQEPEVYYTAARLLAKLAMSNNLAATSLLKGMGMNDQALMPGSDISAATRAKFSEYTDAPPAYAQYRSRVPSSVTPIAV
ncbi:hypothetical protein HWV62_32453 [Athelia sp. TMB]|nr:hypothetical protein HWV62_32453 [Athelia sp. TMB]